MGGIHFKLRAPEPAIVELVVSGIPNQYSPVTDNRELTTDH